MPANSQKRRFRAVSLAALILVAAAPAVGAGKPTVVRAHYGSVSVEGGDGKIAEELAGFLLAPGGVVDDLLVEWEKVDAAVASARKSKTKGAVADIVPPLLDKSVAKEMRRRKKPDDEAGAAPAITKAVEPVRVEFYKDQEKFRALAGIKGPIGSGTWAGYYDRDAERGYVELYPSPVIRRIWGARICVKHALSRYLDTKYHGRVLSRLAEGIPGLSPVLLVDNHWLVGGLLDYYALRAEDPELLIPLGGMTVLASPVRVRDFVGKGLSEMQPTGATLVVPLLLAFVRERDEGTFLRLLAAVNGRTRSAPLDVGADAAADLLGIGEGRLFADWDALESGFGSWWRARLAKNRDRAVEAYARYHRGLMRGE